MDGAQQGLTQTYNQLKDPDCMDERIVELRRLHEETDTAVLAAYGWSDLKVPPYCPRTPDEQRSLETFKDEVIDRLFVLNATRAVEESRRGLSSSTSTRPTKSVSHQDDSQQATFLYEMQPPRKSP